MEEVEGDCRPGISFNLRMHCLGFTASILTVFTTTWWLLPFWYALLIGWLGGLALYLVGLGLIVSLQWWAEARAQRGAEKGRNA
jgi:hypothetical protein